MRVLRDYQISCIDALRKAVSEKKNALAVLACGAGKSSIFSKIAKDICDKNKKVLIIVNKLYLVDQAISNLKHFKSEATIYTGKEKKMSNLVVGTIQTIQKNKEIFFDFDFIIWDEAHSYDMEKFKSLFLKSIHLGFTASPWRGRVKIYGDNKFWHKCYDKSLKELTENKTLVPIIYTDASYNSKFDLKKVGSNSEDYVLKDLVEMVSEQKPKIQKQVEDALSKSLDRKKIIVICISIDHAQEVLKYLDDDATIIHSNLSEQDKIKNYNDFCFGNKRIIVSVMMASEGVDIPNADCLFFFRPTRSPRLYIQAAGRILRKAEGKSNGLFLDYGEVYENLGSVYDLNPNDKYKKKKPFVLICPACFAINEDVNICRCGHQFLSICKFCKESYNKGLKCNCEKSLNIKNLTEVSYSYQEKKTLTLIKPEIFVLDHKENCIKIVLQSGFNRHCVFIPQFKMIALKKMLNNYTIKTKEHLAIELRKYSKIELITNKNNYQEFYRLHF
jgi:DNA repair protein RadD